LLEDHFPNLVDIGFTAKMEQQLDDIASGGGDRLPYLQGFYNGEAGLDHQVQSHEELIDPRIACTLSIPGLESKIRVGRFGPFLQKESLTEGEPPDTASIPADMAPADITNDLAEKLIAMKKQGPVSIGNCPDSGLPIFVLVGPFGPYLQVGQVVEGEAKPKRVSVPKTIDPSSMTFETACKLLSLPRTLGTHPETSKTVTAGVGRFGPYVLHDKVYKSIPKEADVLTIELDAAVELLKQARVKVAPTPLRELGKHPDDDEVIGIFEGRYGPYVKHGGVFASLPKDKAIEDVHLDEALIWLAEKAAKGPVKKGRGRTAGRKKAATEKTTVAALSPVKKKAAKKKAGTKKKAAKKKSAKKKETSEATE